MNYMNNIR